MISKTDSSIDIVKKVTYVYLIGSKVVLYPLLLCRPAKAKMGAEGGEDGSGSFTKEQPHQSAVKMEQLYRAW